MLVVLTSISDIIFFFIFIPSNSGQYKNKQKLPLFSYYNKHHFSDLNWIQYIKYLKIRTNRTKNVCIFVVLSKINEKK